MTSSTKRRFCKFLFEAMINLCEFLLTVVGAVFGFIGFGVCFLLLHPHLTFLPEFWMNFLAIVVSAFVGIIVFILVDLFLGFLFIAAIVGLTFIKVIPEDFLDVEIG